MWFCSSLIIHREIERGNRGKANNPRFFQDDRAIDFC